MKKNRGGVQNLNLKQSPLNLFWGIIRSESGLVGVIFTYELGVGILSLTIPIGVQTVVNTLAFAQLTQPLVFLALAVLLGQFASIVIKATQILILEKLQKRLFANTGMEVAYRIPRMLRESRSEISELINRFFDIVTIQKNVSFLMIEGFSLGLQILVGLTLLAFYHPMLLAFDVLLVLAILFVLFGLGRGAVNSSIDESYEKYEFVNWLEQIAGKNIAFSSKGGRHLALERADSIIQEYLVKRDTHFRIVFRQIIGFLSIHALANTTLLILGVLLVANNQLTIGQLVAAEIVVSTVLYSFTRFQKHLDNYYDLIAAVEKVGTLLGRPLEIGGQVEQRNLLHGDFEFVNVKYKLKICKRLLGPLTFKLGRGERIAICGSNGSGKSAVIDLFYAFQQPFSGYLKYSGYDLRDITPEILRQKIVLVRKIEIIKGTVLENIRFGNSSIEIGEINKILDDLGLLSDILALPQGINTELSEDGGPLSVSQAKRLMLARSIACRPNVLLIDEFIDSLDHFQMEKILNYLFDTRHDWSVVMATKKSNLGDYYSKVIDLDQIEEGKSYVF